MEGPTVQICAGSEQFFGARRAAQPGNCRRMTSVGMAAGIAAAFNAPIAAVTFTLEELIGSAGPDHARGRDCGGGSGRRGGTQHSGLESHFPCAAVADLYAGQSVVAGLVCAAGLAGGDHFGGVHRFAAVAARVVQTAQTVPKWVQPAIGAAATGALAVAAIWFFHSNGIAGDPYKTLTQALLGNLPVTAMAVLCMLKLAATVTSYSSGGSGGIFAPALYMGGMLGGAVGYLDVTVFHHPADSIGAFAVVGMGAVFAGIVRAPMTSILIIFEMTGGYGLVLPLMIANMSAFALARHWRHTPVYEALLEQDGIFLDQKHRPQGPGGRSSARRAKRNAARGVKRCHSRRCRAGSGSAQRDGLCYTLLRLRIHGIPPLAQKRSISAEGSGTRFLGSGTNRRRAKDVGKDGHSGAGLQSALDRAGRCREDGWHPAT